MKKQYFAIAFATLIIACGSSNAEQTITVKEDKVISAEEQTEALLEELVEEVEVAVEEYVETEEIEIVEEKVTETPVVEEVAIVKEKVEAKVTEVIVEETVVEKPVEVVVTKPKHDAWDALTKKYVTSAGKVNYKGMKADLSKISNYLDQLKNLSPKSDWSKNEKLAYWINLYNASTVYLIASNYPVKSIKDINGGKPWDKKFVKSGDKVYTLNQIENDIVRPRFKDPRIHAALNCAAISCPKILNGAFLPSKLDAQLNSRTKSWINNANSNKLTGSTIQVSTIFDWYAVDFKAAGGTIGFINKYAKTKVVSGAKVSFLDYDWALNE